MTLRITRKIKSIYAPGSFSRKKVNPWYTNAVTQKTKKIFFKNKKVYSSELRSSFLKKTLCYKTTAFTIQNKLHLIDTRTTDVCPKTFLNKTFPTFTNNVASSEQKNTLWRLFLSSSLWAFNFPTAVPGAVKIRRAKGLYSSGLHASRNLSFWIGRISMKNILSIYKEILSTRNRHNTNSSTYPFSLLCDNLWPILFIKTGVCKNSTNAKIIITHNLVYKTCKPSENKWSMAKPGQFFISKKTTWDKIFTLFNHNIAKKYHSTIN
jgi:hypothetical protein